jgi:hypothetical protein
MFLFSSHNWPTQCNLNENINKVTSYSNQNLKKTKNNNKQFLCDWLPQLTTSFRSAHGSIHFLALVSHAAWFLLPSPETLQYSRRVLQSKAPVEGSNQQVEGLASQAKALGSRGSSPKAVGTNLQALGTQGWQSCLQALESFYVTELIAVSQLAAAAMPLSTILSESPPTTNSSAVPAAAAEEVSDDRSRSGRGSTSSSSRGATPKRPLGLAASWRSQGPQNSTGASSAAPKAMST